MRNKAVGWIVETSTQKREREKKRWKHKEETYSREPIILGSDKLFSFMFNSRVL